MNERQFPNWIDAYLHYTRVSETPEKIHRWVAVGTLAGALRRRVWIDMGHFRWFPNFYIILVGPPGVIHKSTSVGIGERLLRHVKSVHFGPSATTWQATIKGLEAAHQEHWINGEFCAMSCLTICSSELGSFLDPTDRAQIDVLVDLWDGKLTEGIWEKATVTQGSPKIVNPWINLITCTTPSWIGQHFDKQFLEQGFCARAIFVYGDQKRYIIAYPRKFQNDKELRIWETALSADLETISNIGGEYQLSPDAFEYGEWWYNELERIAFSSGTMYSDRVLGQLQRKYTHLHKLAMVIAASQRNETVIYRQDLETANVWLQEFEVDATRALRLQEITLEAKNAQILERMLAAVGRPVRKSELYTLVWERMNRPVFEESLDAAIQTKRIIATGEGMLKLP